MRRIPTITIAILALSAFGATAAPRGGGKKTTAAQKAAAEKAAAEKAAKDKEAADKVAAEKAAADKAAADKAAADAKNVNATPNGGGGAGGTGGAGTGGGSGSATPPATTDTPPAASGPDVDSLRQEYLALRDELFKSRARANAVASQLYSTRIAIKLTYTSGRFYNPAKSTIRLDGASVYDNTNGAIANDDGVRFDGFVAPGRHVITFRIEATGKDDDSFTSTTEATIVVKAVANKDLTVNAKARDSGDIAYAWKRGESGSYGLAIDVGVKTSPRAVEAAKK